MESIEVEWKSERESASWKMLEDEGMDACERMGDGEGGSSWNYGTDQNY